MAKTSRVLSQFTYLQYPDRQYFYSDVRQRFHLEQAAIFDNISAVSKSPVALSLF